MFFKFEPALNITLNAVNMSNYTGIRTGFAGFKVNSANHITIDPFGKLKMFSFRNNARIAPLLVGSHFFHKSANL